MEVMTMKFITLFQDVEGARKQLLDMMGKKINGATVKHVCLMPVLNDEDDSIAYHALGLCQEGSLLAYLRAKFQAKRQNTWFIRVKNWPVSE